MADSKITALTALTAADPVNDMFPVVDVSDTTMAASGTTKRISANNILSSSPTASGALTVTGLVTAGSASITGAATVGTTLGVTGVSTFAAGTALLPALTTTGDTNTGIYYPAADTFAVTTGGTERYRVDSSGNLLVGKTASLFSTVGIEASQTGFLSLTNSASTNASTNLSLYSTGAAAFRFYVGLGGTVFATNTTISAISDARLKENVQDIDVGLSAILALKPRKFDWKSNKGKDIKGDRGFIAQEFETVFPNLIDEWKDNAPEGEAPYKSVRQDLIPVLVKAIQELTARVQTLEAR
jgi:hypothetical protein